MSDYMNTQKIHDFTVGDLVRVRDDYKKFGDDTTVPGALYRVADVSVISESQGSGTVGLEGIKSKSHWAPRFGHMILDPDVGDLRVGDRVKVTDKRTSISGHPVGSGKSPYVGKTGTLWRIRNEIDSYQIDFDDASLSNSGTWSRDALDLLSVTDLTPGDVRRALPMMEAYPVGSVWNHISSGDQPVTILGPDPDDDQRLMVHVPTYIGDSPYEGSWVRGALDTYGKLVSLPVGIGNFEKADDTPDPQIGDFKVGDRVEVVGWDERWDGPATVVRIGTLYVNVDSDGRKMTGGFSPKYLRHLDDSEKADEVKDAEIKVGDRVMVTEAFGVKSLPTPGTVTAVGGHQRFSQGGVHPYRVTPDKGTLAYSAEGYASGMYAAKVEPLSEVDEAKATAHSLRGEVERLGKRVSDLEGERNNLTQAASDERRRLCAEIDALKVERDAALEDRALYKGRLKASEARSNEGWAFAARADALAEYVNSLLVHEDLLKVDAFLDGWDARKN